MRFASLGSGSEGNGLVVEAGTTRILIDCGFGVRDTAARLARLGVAPESLTAILVTHEHADHVGGVPAFAAKLRHSGVAHVRHARRWSASASTACAQVYGFDSHDVFAHRRPRDPAVPGAARRARARAVRGQRRRASAGRADRHRHVDAVRRGEPDRLRRAGARVQSRSAMLLATSDYPHVAQAAHRRTLRPPAQRGRGGAARGARHEPAAAHHRRAPVAAEQHARARRAPRSPARWAARRTGSASPTRRRASTGARWPDRRRHGKAQRALQRQGEDRLRDRRPAPSRHALPRRRVGVRRRQARQARPEGRDQQQDQRVRDGQARARRAWPRISCAC